MDGLGLFKDYNNYHNNNDDDVFNDFGSSPGLMLWQSFVQQKPLTAYFPY